MPAVCHTSATLSSLLSAEVVKTDATSYAFVAAEDDASDGTKQMSRLAAVGATDAYDQTHADLLFVQTSSA